MTLEEKALEYLEKDSLLHIDMIEAIKRGLAKINYAGEDGVVMEEKRGDTQFLSVKDEKTGEKLLEFLKPGNSVVVHQEFMLETAVEKLRLKRYSECRQFSYLKPEKVYIPIEGIEIRKLGMEWVDTITSIYHLVDSPEYIGLLIELGVMHGAFVDNKLAGFIGMHAEGSMGLLEVLPEFRRKGIGELLESYMIDWNREQGFVPFCQVFTDNAASLKLQKKLGLTASDGYIWWVTD